MKFSLSFWSISTFLFTSSNCLSTTSSSSSSSLVCVSRRCASFFCSCFLRALSFACLSWSVICESSAAREFLLSSSMWWSS
jgi:hypothetical protein